MILGKDGWLLMDIPGSTLCRKLGRCLCQGVAMVLEKPSEAAALLSLKLLPLWSWFPREELKVLFGGLSLHIFCSVPLLAVSFSLTHLSSDCPAQQGTSGFSYQQGTKWT